MITSISIIENPNRTKYNDITAFTSIPDEYVVDGYKLSNNTDNNEMVTHLDRNVIVIAVNNDDESYIAFIKDRDSSIIEINNFHHNFYIAYSIIDFVIINNLLFVSVNGADIFIYDPFVEYTCEPMGILKGNGEQIKMIRNINGVLFGLAGKEIIEWEVEKFEIRKVTKIDIDAEGFDVIINETKRKKDILMLQQKDTIVIVIDGKIDILAVNGEIIKMNAADDILYVLDCNGIINKYKMVENKLIKQLKVIEEETIVDFKIKGDILYLLTENELLILDGNLNRINKVKVENATSFCLKDDEIFISKDKQIIKFNKLLQ